eukprot:12586400-Prorocentrum_lima.AAC.1
MSPPRLVSPAGWASKWCGCGCYPPDRLRLGTMLLWGTPAASDSIAAVPTSNKYWSWCVSMALVSARCALGSVAT